MVPIFFRNISIVFISAFFLLLIKDIYSPSLEYRSAHVLSVDIRTANHSRLLDLLTRPIVTATAFVPEKYFIVPGMSIFFPTFAQGLTTDQQLQTQEKIERLYNDMENSAEWRSLPSSIGYSALDFVAVPPQRAHAYIYVPHSHKTQPSHAVIFLHGSLGNLKVYPYLWSSFAEKTNSIVICVSFGFGFWNREKDILETLYSNLAPELKIPREQTLIVGLSAGGHGVIKELQRHPNYKGAVLISAIVPDILTANDAMAWGKKPILMFNGLSDQIVTVQYAREAENRLTQFGGELNLVPDQGHFLFLMTGFDEISDTIRKKFVW